MGGGAALSGRALWQSKPSHGQDPSPRVPGANTGTVSRLSAPLLVLACGRSDITFEEDVHCYCATMFKESEVGREGGRERRRGGREGEDEGREGGKGGGDEGSHPMQSNRQMRACHSLGGRTGGVRRRPCIMAGQVAGTLE